jgi:hypothetical protein
MFSGRKHLVLIVLGIQVISIKLKYEPGSICNLLVGNIGLGLKQSSGRKYSQPFGFCRKA